MGNLNKELGTLFKRYLIRKEEEAKKPTVFHNANYYKGVWGDKNTFNGTIFFYEWSDIGRTPIRYFSLSLFEKFLSDCDLYLEPHQRDIILNLPKSYITCKHGSKQLIVRGTYDGLKSTMARAGSSETLLPAVPVGVPGSTLRLPPMYQHGGGEQWY
jgi:hypothetical protein